MATDISRLQEGCLSLAWKWLSRQRFLLSLLATAVVSLGCMYWAGMGLLPCMSVTTVLLAVSTVSFSVLAASLLCGTAIPVLCNMPCLAPATRAMLFVTAAAGCAILPLGSIATVILAGGTLSGVTLHDLRVQCTPEATGGTCWEHRCSGITKVFLAEGLILEEYAEYVPVGPYTLRVAPVSLHEGAPVDAQIGREHIQAFAVQWWSKAAYTPAQYTCNRTGGGICATLLWGNVGPVVRALQARFPARPVRPILVPGSPEQFVEAGKPYLLIGFALLLAHSALVIVLTLCMESKTLRARNWQTGGYGRLGSYPSPPPADLVLI